MFILYDSCLYVQYVRSLHANYLFLELAVYLHQRYTLEHCRLLYF